MMQILTAIKSELEKAVKSRDENASSALRFFLAGLHNEEIAKQRQLTDEEVLSFLRRQVKKHQESIEAFQKGGREDLVQKEEGQKKILEAFLPAQMSEEEIRKVVGEVVSAGTADFGQVMGQVMGKLKGQADGAVVAKVVREVLQR